MISGLCINMIFALNKQLETWSLLTTNNWSTTVLLPSADNSYSLPRKSRTMLKINKTTKFNPLRASFLPGSLIIICLRDFQVFITICLILTVERVLILDFLLIFTKKLAYLVALIVISRVNKTLNGNKRTYIIFLVVFPDTLVKISYRWLKYYRF